MTAASRARMRVWVPLLVIGAASWAVLVLDPARTAHGSAHGARTPLLAEAALMFAAMMVPLIGAPVRYVCDRSFARRRPRAVALFAAGYAVPWIAAAALLLAAGKWIVAADSAVVLALAFVGITVWQCSPWKQHCLNRCHAHPELAAFGARADLSVLRFGFTHALWCIGSCSALMVLPLLFTRGHLAVMAGVTLWIAGERLDEPMPPRWRVRGPVRIVRVALGQARVWLKRTGKDVLVPPATTS
jgi:predicted metal-binding membrane protein